jgi:transposase-like protein
MNTTNNNEIENCPCKAPQCNAENFNFSFWATDTTNNRFAEISIYTCKHCNSQWVHYFVEYEAYSKSGRWYRCRITPLQLQQLTANNTVDFLEQAADYFYGGSYFNTTGKYGSGKVKVD